MSILLTSICVISVASSSGQEALEAKVAKLVGELGADEVAVREKAAGELQRIGKPALAALGKALESKDPEIRVRAAMLIGKIRTLNVDAQGRTLVERDDKGWNVEYTRDEAGNVTKKAWVNPEDRSDQAVRLYSYNPKHRLTQEVDPAGRMKEILLGEDGEAAQTHRGQGFLEEGDQVRRMAPPRRKESPVTTTEHDDGDRVIRPSTQEKK
jgi:YD repeat-containing protein